MSLNTIADFARRRGLIMAEIKFLISMLSEQMHFGFCQGKAGGLTGI